MRSRKYSRRQLPPCPDPDRYILVKTDEGYYWRRRRGTVKKATVNEVLTKNARGVQITAPAASRLLRKLQPHLAGIKKGSIHLKISGLLLKTMNEKGAVDFSKLQGLELNKVQSLERLFHGRYAVKLSVNAAVLRIEQREGRLQAQNNLVTDYYFEAILIYGDATEENSLRVDSAISPLFTFEQPQPGDCEFQFALPDKKTWMLLLKVNCLEGNELAAHPMHYVLKVVMTGEGNV